MGSWNKKSKVQQPLSTTEQTTSVYPRPPLGPLRCTCVSTLSPRAQPCLPFFLLCLLAKNLPPHLPDWTIPQRRGRGGQWVKVVLNRARHTRDAPAPSSSCLSPAYFTYCLLRGNKPWEPAYRQWTCRSIYERGIRHRNIRPIPLFFLGKAR